MLTIVDFRAKIEIACLYSRGNWTYIKNIRVRVLTYFLSGCATDSGEGVPIWLMVPII
jgi:hypothetical protein